MNLNVIFPNYLRLPALHLTLSGSTNSEAIAAEFNRVKERVKIYIVASGLLGEVPGWELQITTLRLSLTEKHLLMAGHLGRSSVNVIVGPNILTLLFGRLFTDDAGSRPLPSQLIPVGVAHKLKADLLACFDLKHPLFTRYPRLADSVIEQVAKEEMKGAKGDWRFKDEMLPHLHLLADSINDDWPEEVQRRVRLFLSYATDNNLGIFFSHLFSHHWKRMSAPIAALFREKFLNYLECLEGNRTQSLELSPLYLDDEYFTLLATKFTALKSLALKVVAFPGPGEEVEVTLRLSSLASFQQLTTLELRRLKHVTDLAALIALKNLQSLELAASSVNNLTSLNFFKELRFLRLSWVKITDLRPHSLTLSSCEHLESLDLSYVDLEYLELASSLSRIRKVALCLKGEVNLRIWPLPSLEELALLYTCIRTLEFLRGLKNLKKLRVRGSLCVPIVTHPIGSLSKLTHLTMAEDTPESAVHDLTFMASLTSLESLWLTVGACTDLTPLSFLSKPYKLEMTITDGIHFPNPGELRSLISLAVMDWREKTPEEEAFCHWINSLPNLAELKLCFCDADREKDIKRIFSKLKPELSVCSVKL